ncbi:ribosome biogenesis protein SLX9 homolog [Tubulanus polymorphus]|uniref:ribosome biogenesis protein SLX9 homolog n=1 Tax=Tubulanus polymorphus TaxID=672921 RepID=UPI003DA67507
MGKEKRKRRKYHASSSTNNAKTDKESNNKKTQDLPTAKLGENVFEGIKIGSSLLSQKLPDFDARSAITSKTFKGVSVTKKDKQKIKREAWMQKMDSVQAAKRAVKEKKKRERTAIVGDMKPLEDALPTLELLLKEGSKTKERKGPAKRKAFKTEVARKREMMDEVAAFKKVFNDPEFKQNPQKTVSELLKTRMKYEDFMET